MAGKTGSKPSASHPWRSGLKKETSPKPKSAGKSGGKRGC